MLPQKKRRLLIGVIGVMTFIIIILVTWLISTYIKDKNKEDERDNSNYASTYSYYAIKEDEDGVYKIYGITTDSEKYIGLRSFYKIQDIKFINKKLVLYFDALNEVRYDAKSKEFYYYELDSYYKNGNLVQFYDNYMFIIDNDVLSFKAIGQDELTEIKKMKDLVYLYSNNKVYYLDDNKLIAYDLVEKNSKILEELESKMDLIDVVDNFIILKNNEKTVYYYDIKEEKLQYIDNLSSDHIWQVWSEGIVTNIDGTLLKYELGTNRNADFTYEFEEKATLIKYLGDDEYFIKLKEGRNYILDLKNKSIVREFNDDIIDIVKVD